MAAGQPVTSTEVARQAGVSRATVSYVLNGVDNQRISAATRAHVLSVAEKLGYSPNAAARALRSGRSDLVVLALPPWPHGPIVVEAIDAAVAELSRLGYTPLVHFEPSKPSQALIQACRRIQPAGMVAPGERLSERIATQLRAGWTKGVVAIASRPLQYVPTVVVDQSVVGRVAIEYLSGRGHRRVLAVMPPGPGLADLREGRLRGASEAAARTGIRLEALECALDYDSLRSAIQARLQRRRPPTAAYTFNDDYALLVGRVLGDLGVDIPGDVALLGCDDVATAQLVRPALTSVRIDGKEFGTTIAKYLHAAISGTATGPDVNVLSPVVIERESA